MTPDRGGGGIGVRLLLGLVRAYQALSRLTPPRCRFYPTCSAYAVRSLQHHGAWRGTALAARRLLRCHPFNPGGVDHVPESGRRLQDQGATA